MIYTLYLWLGVAATVLANHPHAHAKRQDSDTSVTKTVAGDNTAISVAEAATTTSLHMVIDLKEAQLDYLMEVCMPNYYEFIEKYRDVAYTPEDWAAMKKKLEASEFPCELEGVYSGNCIEDVSDDKTRDAKKEQDCLCSSNFFEIKRVCFDCYRVHGFDPLEADYSKASVLALQTAFCSATKAVLYGDAYTSRKDVSYTGSYTGDMMKFVSGTDLYPSQTDISHYYTAPSATTTAASNGAAQTTGTDGSAAPAATPNGAGQLKAAGGMAMAFLGVIAAL